MLGAGYLAPATLIQSRHEFAPDGKLPIMLFVINYRVLNDGKYLQKCLWMKKQPTSDLTTGTILLCILLTKQMSYIFHYWVCGILEFHWNLYTFFMYQNHFIHTTSHSLVHCYRWWRQPRQREGLDAIPNLVSQETNYESKTYQEHIIHPAPPNKMSNIQQAKLKVRDQHTPGTYISIYITKQSFMICKPKKG